MSNSFGEDCVFASKRRQGGKVETHSDLVRGREAAECQATPKTDPPWVVLLERGAFNVATSGQRIRGQRLCQLAE